MSLSLLVNVLIEYLLALASPVDYNPMRIEDDLELKLIHDLHRKRPLLSYVLHSKTRVLGPNNI